ncbi:hypothetical protein MNBD_GAMMA22-2936 [hydrothermal vent metagenome]|uniref:Uncharacterized protein n=1 Tax=hydrothermal vent metagenome TaxID=652676 RepID=A0A3B1AIY5_9ZZZZ
MIALRWFLSYLLPILIITGIAVSYFYRDRLTSNWYQTLSWPVSQITAALQQQKVLLINSEPKYEVNVTSTVQEKSNLDKKLIVQAEKTVIIPDVKLKKITTKKSSENNNIVFCKHHMQPIPCINKTSVDDTNLSILSSDVKALMDYKLKQKSSDNEVLAKTKKSEFKEKSNATKALATTSSHKQTDTSTITLSTSDLRGKTDLILSKQQHSILYQARKAYWGRNISQAKKHYLILAQQISDNPDIHGELGNIFYNGGEVELAIKHYSLAAKLLIKQRYYWKLSRIMPIIAKFNPSKATNIMQLMRTK